MLGSCNMLRLAAVLLLGCASSLAQDSERAGIVRGVVLDASDQPVQDSRVRANFTGGFDGIVPSARTDTSGHFVIKGLAWGKWYVTASKEQDGYPDESNGFYGGLSSPAVLVALDTEHAEHTVTVHLGRKAGAIFGSVADAQTGKPVEPCAELRWKDAPHYSWQGYGLLKSGFRVLVPADTDITLTVWLWGYEPWFYGSNDGQDFLRVHAGDQLSIPIVLTPNKDKTRPLTDQELKKMRESISAKGISAYDCGEPPPKP